MRSAKVALVMGSSRIHYCPEGASSPPSVEIADAVVAGIGGIYAVRWGTWRMPSVKTAKECDAEYSANKAAIRGSGEKKKDFVAACRAGTENIPASAPAPYPLSAPTAPRAAPARPRQPLRPRKPAAASTNAGAFTSDAQA